MDNQSTNAPETQLTPAETPQAPNTSLQPTVESQPTVGTPPQKPRARNWKKWVLIMVALLLIIAGGILVLSRQKTEQSEKLSTNKPTISVPSPTPDPTINWKTYSSDTFSFNYPAKWYLGQRTGEGNPGGGYDQIEFSNFPYSTKNPYSSEHTNKADYIQLRVHVNFSSSGENTLYNFINEIPIGTEKTYSETKETYTREKDFIANKDLTFMKYSFTNPSYGFSIGLSAMNKKDSNFYEITLVSHSQSNLDKKRETFDQILQTFKFTDHTINQNSTNYLTVDSWKVRIMIDETLAGLKIADAESAFAPTDSAVKILAPMLNNVWLCSGDTEASIGSISRTASEVRSGPYKPLATKKVGNFTYGYEATPTSNCTSDPKYQELVKEFTAAFSSLESY